MNKYIIILLVVILGLNVVSIILGLKFRDYMRKRRMKNMSKSERKRWQQFEKYRVSKGGNWKTVAFMISILIVFIAATIVLGSFRKVYLLLAIVFIPVLLIEAEYTFKTRNKDKIISFVFLLFITIGFGLYGVGIIPNFWIIFIPLFIFIGYNAINMKSEQEAVNLFCNFVVSTGIDIDSQLDGYSQRPYSKESDDIKNKLKDLNFKKITEKFARVAGKELIFMDWKIDDNAAIFYPTPNSFIYTEIFSIFSSFKKSKPSSIKLDNNGRITVFISKKDYDRIVDPVTYHILCRGVNDKFEESFLEFANNNKMNSIKILRGEKNG